MGDPYFENNFLNSSLWHLREWVYRTSFALPRHLKCSTLVFEGIKMGATVSVNGHHVGNATNQFLRYRFPLPTNVLRGDALNVLEVRFTRGMELDGRFMAASGGWDWAPRSDTWHGEAKSFSKGIWRSVYLASAETHAPTITHVVPLISYRGMPPTSRLHDGRHNAGFDVRVRVHLSAETPTSGNLCIQPSWPGGSVVELNLTVPAGESEATLHLKATTVRLWWPLGMGAQPLYTLRVTFRPGASNGGDISTLRRVGFRQVALVTYNDSDSTTRAAATTAVGSGEHGMFLRVNGVAVWARGANVVPMEQLEGRLDDRAHRSLVRSAARAHMNLLRVWGGGTFAPDALYDACDEEGVMVMHDFMYAQHGHAASVTTEQAAEIAHQVRRLSPHPSIVAWVACNECKVTMGTASSLYATFVMTHAAREDPSRPVWPSSPSLGWSAGVRRSDGVPDGSPLVARDCSEPARSRARKAGVLIETHGPYLRSSGWAAVDGLGAAAQRVSTALPLPLPKTLPQLGTAHPSRFVSELGAVGMPSFESLAAQLRPSRWALHAGQPAASCAKKRCVGSNVMAQRNYPCDSLILSYFGRTLGLTQPPADQHAHNERWFNRTGREPFRAQLYLCALAQALWIKSAIETSRTSRNELGLLLWQLNDQWPTGGWGDRASTQAAAPCYPGCSPVHLGCSPVLPRLQPRAVRLQPVHLGCSPVLPRL